jgi:uncharacterized ferritin-like protein (DUF455 family)
LTPRKVSNAYDIHAAAHVCLMERDPSRKCARVAETRREWEAGSLDLGGALPSEPVPVPGRPDRPRLVAPKALARRGVVSAKGLAALIHALAHIEFNAINLALDAVYRFRGLPVGFYTDWVRVTAEEAYHFRLLRELLHELGHDYGDLPAHNGLWEMACHTDHDPLLRMALVPRVLEARGLDVTPGMIERLRLAGAGPAANVLEIIYRDEIGHVQVGTHWFRYLCEQRGLEPRTTFLRLLSENMRGRVKGPFNEEGRQQAGFTPAELLDLKSLEAKHQNLSQDPP